MENKKLFLFLFFVFILPIVYGVEECRGTIAQDEVPCLVLLPINTTITPCNNVTVSFFNNASTLLDTQIMVQYNTFTCNATFNPEANLTDILGTYTFMYSTGDSGSIIVEVGTLNFFNLTVYLVLSALAITFLVFMHIFKDGSGSGIVYGWISTALNVIIASVILSPDFTVIRGVILFIDADFYFAFLSLATALFTAITSINIKRSMKTGETTSVF